MATYAKQETASGPKSKLAQALASIDKKVAKLDMAASTLTTAVAEVPKDSWSVTLAPPGRAKVAFAVIGAGGVGARIIPALAQMARRNDVIKVIDHDIVESRNLHRQHFTGKDIGSPKAAIMSRRYSREFTSVQSFVTALKPYAEDPYQLWKILNEGTGAALAVDGISHYIIIGAVDNPTARIAMWDHFNYIVSQGRPVAYIDVGNEMRGGQVILNAVWPGRSMNTGTGFRSALASIRLEGKTALANLWEPAPVQTAEDIAAAEETRCAARLDLQTVVVNNMGAALVLNVVNSLLNGLPIAAAGCYFSTLNSVSPIPMVPKELGGIVTFIGHKAVDQS